jgi:hypothetical protein
MEGNTVTNVVYAGPRYSQWDWPLQKLAPPTLGCKIDVVALGAAVGR